MATRKELTEAVAQRYRAAAKRDKSKILDEFVALTKYHRKHAIRVRRSAPREPHQRPGRNRLYDEAVRQALIVLWEASDRLCGKRLKALVPLLVDAMERHCHIFLDAGLKDKLLRTSDDKLTRARALAHSVRMTR